MERQQKDKRKFLLALPLLVLPFLALAFWALGGGKGNRNITEGRTTTGINVSLPDAKFKKEKPKTKLDFYEQAGRDTVVTDEKDFPVTGQFTPVADRDLSRQTEHINKKLEQITRQINYQPEVIAGKAGNIKPTAGMSNDVDRLEALMKNIQGSNTEDPEISQLNGMLDKILKIQHPEQVKDKHQKPPTSKPDSVFRAIRAIIEESRKVTQGSAIKLRLQDTVTLNGQLIPKNHFVYGICNITNQRLLLDIRTIRLGTSIIPVNLTMYSMDGMKGIEAREAVLAEAVNGGAGDAVSGLQLMSYDPSLTTKMAEAGIDAAKRAFSKKVRRVKVKLRAGSPVLLRDNEQRNSR